MHLNLDYHLLRILFFSKPASRMGNLTIRKSNKLVKEKSFGAFGVLVQVDEEPWALRSDPRDEFGRKRLAG